MTDIAITVEGLSKRYRIGLKEEQRDTLVGLLKDLITKPARNLRRLRRLTSFGDNEGSAADVLWALKDVSFRVPRGEVVGIIGHNAAGKSTLLKILSRITEPTSGRATVAGRLASLLEVGTGFHPELTGRENIYLNAAIMGMKKAEIRRKFDEIVSFAGVERFIDTPVKHYSSGMYVRLGFSVAAHQEPEILIIDEVLAVGDAQFQKKCLGKMKEVGREGRTVLFVSHNMNAIEQLCDSALLLSRGKVESHSRDVRQVIRQYLHDTTQSDDRVQWVNTSNVCDHPSFRPISFRLSTEDGGRPEIPLSNDSAPWVEILCDIREADPGLSVGYAIYTEDNDLLYWSYQTDRHEAEWRELSPGTWSLRSRLPSRLLNEGTYRIELLASLHFREWLIAPNAAGPSLDLTIQGGLSDSPFWIARRPGILAPVLTWEAERVTRESLLHAGNVAS
jgi:lipopolysaccharide transport system ATP-binding protein